MTKEYLWQQICQKNPSFSSDDSTQITLSSRGLKKMFELVWKEGESVGYDRGIEVSKRINKMSDQGKQCSDNNIFDKMFGKGFNKK